MPLIFFVGGTLFAASLDRRPVSQVLPDRFKRLLLPLALFSAIGIAIIGIARPSELEGWPIHRFVLYFVPLQSPSGPLDRLSWVWIGLWFVRAYMWFLILGGPARWLFRRAPVIAFGLPLGALAILLYGNDWIGWSPGWTAATGDLAAYGTFWLLGYAYHDRWFARIGVGARVQVAIVMSLAAIMAYAALSPAGGDVSNEALAHLLFGLAWVSILLAVEQPLSALVRVQPVRSIARFLGLRAYTIYLGQFLALLTVEWLLVHDHLPTLANNWTLSVATYVAPALALYVLLAGWLEDVAANRPPQLWPGVEVPTRRRAVPA
jgi:hypothetical protein